MSRNDVGRQKGFDDKFRLKTLQYKQEHHPSCMRTALHFRLDVVTVRRWDKQLREEGVQGIMMKKSRCSSKAAESAGTGRVKTGEQTLSEENYRLRMENDYLKKLNALIQKREKSK